MSNKSKDKLNSSTNTLFSYFARSPVTPKIKLSGSGSTPTSNNIKTEKSTPSSASKEKSSSHSSSSSKHKSPQKIKTEKSTPSGHSKEKSPNKTSHSSSSSSHKSPNRIKTEKSPTKHSGSTSCSDTPTSNRSPSKKIKTEKSKSPKEKSATKAPPSDDEENEEIAPMKKRRRILMNDDSSDEGSDTESREKNGNANGKTPSKIDMSMFKYVPRKESDELVEPPALKKMKLEQKPPAKELRDMLDDDEDEASTVLDEPTVWAHQKLDFLRPEKIKDIQGNKPGSEKYDSRTLYVPESYLATLTPAMRQWWELKSRHMDCVLFFKVGKFYELYHMDASIGVSELGFSFMKGDFAHSGFPEQAYERMASLLVEKGYKVARVEQTETPEMMQERCKKNRTNSKYDKVVRREICQVTLKGTEVFGQQVQLTLNHQPRYMLTIAELAKNASVNRYGVCFIDTSLGTFHLGEFDDDNQSSRLLTLLSHYPPALVLHERAAPSPGTHQVFKTVLGGIPREALTNESQFWTAEKTLKYLAENFYGSSSAEGESKWPEVFQLLLDKSDHLGLTPDSRFKLAVKALGGCVWYLKRCLLDQQILALASFELYVPPDDVAPETVGKIVLSNRFMVLDSITLSNLRISEGEDSLYNKMDHCCTNFGKRLLHHWICSPSCEREVIVQRQEAVSELLEDVSLLQDVRQILGELPDLERMLAQIHTFGNAERSKNHPDGRAILYEERSYGKKKIQDFITTVNAFNSLTKLPDMFVDASSKLLVRITQTEKRGGIFPDMVGKIRYFEDAFDQERALNDGVIAPGSGVDEEYDAVQQEIEDINEELEKYRVAQEKYFGCKISYFGNDKKRFQLDVPETAAKKAGSRYTLEGQNKSKNKTKRFHTDETRDFLKRMMQAEDKRRAVLKDLSRRMFEKFSKHYALWKSCLDLIGTLDVLTSLAEYARSEGNSCVPEILEDDTELIFDLVEGVHPCMTSIENYIPNGVQLGTDGTRLILLTGPNMGGKSTLMRQVGMLAIMAQVGSLLPAESCRLTIIDRLFTRLGANDDMAAGHSTFLVELNETSTILKHATEKSLVLLDELGRGTATYDGTAVAGAVVKYLADLRCRTMFSTHYHNLVDNFVTDSRVRLGHMACMVENDAEDEDPTQETVTFLYKYADGPCPKSYGFNAAKVAGMPDSIIRRAHQLSKQVEADALKRKIFIKTMLNADLAEIKDLLIKLKACKV